MSEELLVQHCAPTLAGIKTGSLFTCPYASQTEMRDALRHYNRLLGKKGLRLLPLRYREGRALIYMYRPLKLSCDLKQESVYPFLVSCGYSTESPERCIVRLIQRLAENGEFPHEIGFFLGYPPEDVRGFIENKACKYKCAGCWKVYGDVEAAQRLFEKYRKCTAVYVRQHAEGKSIERLTVVG